MENPLILLPTTQTHIELHLGLQINEGGLVFLGKQEESGSRLLLARHQLLKGDSSFNYSFLLTSLHLEVFQHPWCWQWGLIDRLSFGILTA